ncbi:MAG: FHA domain-containing protein [Isosphaeraceae bacterium]|nr:FHA domain-containing protein [Isosphaeraceae bacterium]
MVKPGGYRTMLGHWRIVLRQAEEAARAGRYDEAVALVSRPDVADHRNALHLRGRLAQELVARASRRGCADDVSGAIDDLDLAERIGAPPDALAAARLSLADLVAAEVRADLDAGEPARVAERIEKLAKHKVSGPSLRRTREIAEAWQAALDEARRGEFGRAQDHLDRAERLANGSAPAALAVTRREIETRQKTAAPKVEALYQVLATGKWPEILAAAEAVLDTVPEHPAARQSRANAWHQIAAIAPAAKASFPQPGARVPQAPPAAEQEPEGASSEGIVWLNATVRPADGPLRPRPRPAVPARRLPAARTVAQRSDPGPSGRFLLWVDAVGGYLVCLDHQVILGRAGSDSQADVPLMGDLARHHATIVRDGESYVIRAQQATYLNGKKVESAPLRDGDVIRLGPSVELEFRQPSPVSATARLTVVSRHRLPLAVDGVLLMGETCIVGPSPQAHVLSKNLSDSIVLYRQGAAVWCRAPGSFEVDGRPCSARAPLTLQSSVLGEGFSFSLEALGNRVV